MPLEDSATRAEARYAFEVPVSIELSRGLFRPADRIHGIIADMSKSGAAIRTTFDDRLRLNRRYRVIVDDHVGIILVKNIVQDHDDRIRMGVQFKRLGLELQEIVSDAIQEAQWVGSRLDQRRIPSDLTAGR